MVAATRFPSFCTDHTGLDLDDVLDASDLLIFSFFPHDKLNSEAEPYGYPYSDPASTLEEKLLVHQFLNVWTYGMISPLTSASVASVLPPLLRKTPSPMLPVAELPTQLLAISSSIFFQLLLFSQRRPPPPPLSVSEISAPLGTIPPMGIRVFPQTTT
ncbi:hypothetical protein K435DRAFT_875705 [Dendrothele bispora CBS 962.96]|uniref:Uncharacterized protein n=1 Tax=Dendrothele bispora (strain CBS 962.96) TaxID=1314807 RepID=A0A4S8KU12_DENBC|nr:hypothetical protein K435DRAFT_875705 [Dendrothele bispora CBS 962.96]